VLGFVDEATSQRGIPRYITEQQGYDKMLSILRGYFGNDELAKLMAAGKAWLEERAFEEALAL
jgi:hypothetical protein